VTLPRPERHSAELLPVALGRHVGTQGGPKGGPGETQCGGDCRFGEPQVRQRLADIGQDIFPREQQNALALAEMQKAEIEKWWPIIKAAGIKAE
jgi:hypothetical protein